MGKKFRRLLSLLMVVVMTMGLSLTGWAADTTYTITIKYASDNHTYEAYQIFKGDLDTTENVLSNIEWGSGVNGTALLAALIADSTVVDPGTDLDSTADDVTVAGLFASCTTAADVAKVLSDNNKNTTLAERFAQLASEHLGTVAGTSTQENVVKTDSEGNTVYDTEGNVVTVHATDGDDKYIYEIDVTGAGYYLVKDQDASMTDKSDAYTDIILEVVSDVTVVAKAYVPTLDKTVGDVNDSDSKTDQGDTDSADYDIGDAVPFTLTATLPSNYDDYKTYKLVFHDTMSAGLTYDEDSVVVTVNGTAISDSLYTKTSSTDANGITTIEITISNLKTIDNTLVAGNTVVVTYNATLNENASFTEYNDAHLEYSNNPNDESGGTTGNTPDDKTTVFTFTLNVNKTDENGNTLTGAVFTLSKYDAGTQNYKIVGTIGYEKVTISTFDSNVTYYTYNDSSKTYEKVTDTSGAPDSGTDYYVIGSLSKFTFEGLDDGKYKLVETITPDGYNTLDDYYFTVEAEHTEDGITSLTIKDANGDVISGLDSDGNPLAFTTSTSDGSISTNIKNYKGSELPSTGGIGTTIFYVIGGILVAGAAVLLITKKRLGKME